MRGKDFVISKPQQFSKCREQAEYLSRFLHLPLADATTDRETAVRPDRTRDTLRERLQSVDIEALRADRPLTMRCEVEESDGYARIVIRPRASLLAGGFAVFISAVLLLVLICFFLRSFSRSETPLRVRVFFLILVLGVFAVPLIIGGINMMVGRKRKRTTVKASTTGLVIERRGAWRTRTTVVSAADILDLDYGTFGGEVESSRRSARMTAHSDISTTQMFAVLKKLVPTRGIIVKTRAELIRFGEGLPVGELQYLTFVLRKVLARR